MAYNSASGEAEFGKRARLAVVTAYRAAGYRVIDLEDEATNATLVQGPHGEKSVAMDLVLMKRGSTRWSDVKGKSAPVHIRKRDVLRHGIDKPHWHHYRQQEEESGQPGELAIVQLRESASGPLAPRWMRARLSDLEARLRSDDAYGEDRLMHFGPASAQFPRGSVNWDLADFDDCGEIRVSAAGLVETRVVVHPWEKPDRFGLISKVPHRDKSLLNAEELGVTGSGARPRVPLYPFPDLQEWVARHGGYWNIPWDRWDAEMQRARDGMRRGLIREGGG